MKTMNALAMSLLAALSIQTQAAPAKKLTPKQASKQIAKAVDIFSPLAESGVKEFKVAPTTSVFNALRELAEQEGLIDEEFGWVGKDNSAWDGDSSNWGETTMKSAYSYITEESEDRLREIDELGTPADKVKYLADIKAAKEAFKLLLNTGVQFGVVPMGAVQCGFTFAALAIIDPHTGKVYVFAKEGSGC